ncbi:MAG: helix-turn-helix transcriptional regulator [Balneola sp.]
MKTVNERLKDFREEKRLSRREMAKILDVTDTTIQNIEEKGSAVKSIYLVNLSKKFPNEIDYNEWLDQAAVDEIRRDIAEVREPDKEFNSSSLEDYEAQLVAILDEVERTFSNDQAKLQFVEVMLRMIRKRKAKLDDLDS